MASGSGEKVAAREVRWLTVMPELAEAGAAVAYEPIVVVNELKPYSLRNGKPEEIEPYLLTAAIPSVYHWVPINNLAPKDALRCIDGFIRCYMFRLANNPPPETTDVVRRKMAIILGTCRAVMTTNYDLLVDDLNAKELTDPVLSVVVPPAGNPAYTTLVPAGVNNIDMLTNNLALTEDEMEVVKVLARCAQAVIPIQGLNLITDGHHYLSEKSKQSYKAFLAVERQLWVGAKVKAWVQASEETVRDVLWHKVGHPVAISLKEAAATDPMVKANLELAKMGSAAARLPALESDLRAADTYMKLAEAVGAIWATLDGGVECEMLKFRVAAVKTMPRTRDVFAEPFDMGNGVKVNSRAGAVNVLKATVAANADKAAILYGFYCSMLDSTGGDMSGSVNDTLRSAFSLKKLRANNIASYLIGTETYKDYRAMKQAARRSAERKMPSFVFNV